MRAQANIRIYYVDIRNYSMDLDHNESLSIHLEILSMEYHQMNYNTYKITFCGKCHGCLHCNGKSN